MISLKPLKEKISITVDSDILEKIRDLAEKDDRSLSQYINIVLKQHIKEIEDKSENKSMRSIVCNPSQGGM